MSQESGFSAHPPEKLKSAFPGQSSAFQTFSPNPCLVQQVPAIPSSISFAGIFFRQASQKVSSFILQLLLCTDWHACFLDYRPHDLIAASFLLHPATWQKPDYKLHGCLLLSLSDFMAKSLMAPSSCLPVQRSRRSSALPMGSMAETLSHGFPLHY